MKALIKKEVIIDGNSETRKTITKNLYVFGLRIYTSSTFFNTYTKNIG